MFGELQSLPVNVADPTKTERLHSCPIYLVCKAPGVQDVWRLHMHWSKSQLQMIYPDGAPIAVMRAIEAFEHGSRRGENDRRKEDKAKLDSKNPKR